MLDKKKPFLWLMSIIYLSTGNISARTWRYWVRTLVSPVALASFPDPWGLGTRLQQRMMMSFAIKASLIPRLSPAFRHLQNSGRAWEQGYSCALAQVMSVFEWGYSSCTVPFECQPNFFGYYISLSVFKGTAGRQD